MRDRESTNWVDLIRIKVDGEFCPMCLFVWVGYAIALAVVLLDVFYWRAG